MKTGLIFGDPEPDGGFVLAGRGFTDALKAAELFYCPDGRSLRGSVGTLSGLSRDREPYGSSASPFWARRAVLIYGEYSILFRVTGNSG